MVTKISKQYIRLNNVTLNFSIASAMLFISNNIQRSEDNSVSDIRKFLPVFFLKKMAAESEPPVFTMVNAT